MPHLNLLRGGWTSERLAELILSGISFIGKPGVVADDIGADFYCTLINRRSYEGRDYLVPTTPFVVQVKSSKRVVSLTKHLPYLTRLAAPFFIGVTNLSLLTLTLYSGRYLPFLLALKGDRPKSITARPTRARKVTSRSINEAAQSPSGRIRLPMPKLLTLKASSTQRRKDKAAAVIHSDCEKVAFATYSRLTGHYFLPFPGTELRGLVAGSGSARTFRPNYQDRLAEYMKNLEWISKEQPHRFHPKEAEALLRSAEEMQRWLPDNAFFRKALRRLRRVV